MFMRQLRKTSRKLSLIRSSVIIVILVVHIHIKLHILFTVVSYPLNDQYLLLLLLLLLASRLLSSRDQNLHGFVKFDRENDVV
uniref:Uncharacterized protein n=1 Tax=Helianthus annuus TaxID=4232 RepID=A0A251TNJ7_HELAN